MKNMTFLGYARFKGLIPYKKLSVLSPLIYAVANTNQLHWCFRYLDFAKRLDKAEKSLDRREERLRQVYESVEVNLQLIGAIGIEDRLQVSYLLYEQIKSIFLNQHQYYRLETVALGEQIMDFEIN